MMIYLNSDIAIITINVSGLNTPTRMQRLSYLDKKARPKYMLPTKTSFKYKDTNRLKIKG